MVTQSINDRLGSGGLTSVAVYSHDSSGNVTGLAGPSGESIPIDMSGLWNFKPANYLNARKGIANVKAGLANMNVLYLADSTGCGYNESGTANEFAFSPAKFISQQLTAQGIPSGWSNRFGDNSVGFANVHTYDTRMAAIPAVYQGNFDGGNWIGDKCIGAIGAHTAANIVFTPATNTDTLDIYYVDVAGYAAITGIASAGVSSPASVTPAGSARVRKATFTTTVASASWTITDSGLATVLILGWSAYLSTTKEISILNCSCSGETSSAIINVAQYWQSLNSVSTNTSELISPLAIYAYGLNDCQSAGAIALFYSQASTAITALQAAGTNVILMIPPPVSTGVTPHTTYYPTLVADYYRLASTFDCALIDLNSRWVSNAVSYPLGYYRAVNDLHPSKFGYADMAAALVQFFKRL
jgi:lysophospholipase L1-like esterase